MTVTTQVSFLLPSFVVTVIKVFPLFLPLTNPFWSIVATLGLDEDHVTSLFDASVGEMVAVNRSSSSISNVIIFLFNLTPVTEIGSILSSFTVT